MSGDIFLNIDRIVLHGMDHVDRHVFADALKQNLTKQLSQTQYWNTSQLPKLETHISPLATNNANLLGQSLAEAIGGILTDSQESSTPKFPADDARKKDGRNV